MKYIFIIVISIIPVRSFSQPNTNVPAEAREFIINGYEALDYQTGDLNGDKKDDAILILKAAGEDTLQTENFIDPKRPMLILIRQINGKLKLAKRNDSIIMCRQCGGIFGDPYEGLTISTNSFDLDFYGGSAWRWSFKFSFKYNDKAGNWYISEESESSYWTGDLDGSFNSTVIPASESGDIPFEKYTGYSAQDAKKTDWKVVADKAYFYDTASLASKHLKAYLIKNDTIDTYRETQNFVLIEFENKKGKTTRGFIRKMDLIRQ